MVAGQAASLALQFALPCATLDFSAGPHFSFNSIGNKKDTDRRLIRGERLADAYKA